LFGLEGSLAGAHFLQDKGCGGLLEHQIAQRPGRPWIANRSPLGIAAEVTSSRTNRAVGSGADLELTLADGTEGPGKVVAGRTHRSSVSPDAEPTSLGQ
jgi:hypothetical protein